MKTQEFQQIIQSYINNLKDIVTSFPTSWQKKKAIIDMFKKMIAKHMLPILQAINNLTEEFEENEELADDIEDKEIALIVQTALENELEMDIAELQNKTITDIQAYYNLLGNSYTLYYNSLIPLQNPLEPLFRLDIPNLEPLGIVKSDTPLVSSI